MTLFRTVFLFLSETPWIRHLITSRRISKKLANRFIAGETLEEAFQAAQRLNRKGMWVTFDLVGEKVAAAEDAEKAVSQYLAILEKIQETHIPANISLKLTHLGLDLSQSLCSKNLEEILSRASILKNFIRIDMEDSSHTERTLTIFKKVYRHYQNVGVVLQAALYRSETYLEELMKMGVRIRLCKGAYLEPPTLAFSCKKDVDRNFSILMKKLLLSGNYPAMATHDSLLIEEAKVFAREHHIDSSRFEFQMLYGIRRDLQEQLMREGYNLRIYVPFGKEWYPYFMRRLAERPANFFFFLTSLLRR